MQKISIKREQSQAGLSFAEREKFRPQVKNKLLLLLVLLLMATTGAMAQTETLADGSYYVKNGALSLYMAAGGNWGTQGIVNERGLDLIFTYNSGTKTYTIDSRLNNGDNHFLDTGLHMDAPSFGWTVEGENSFTISAKLDGVKHYLAVDQNNILVFTEDGTAENAQWIIIPKADNENAVLAAGLDALKAATAENGVDATFLIACPGFNRNDKRNAEAWTVEANRLEMGGAGSEGNGCAESYNSTFTLSQTLSNAPAGVYTLTAQGFYKQNGSDNENLPYFYANDEKQAFKLLEDQVYNMSDAGPLFTQGKYTIDPITVVVAEDGALTIGAKLETNTRLWSCWDNFKLTYYGPLMYSVTLADGTKDADKWTVKVGEGQAQALPIGGLKGDGSETVTLQYNGRLKVKSVKATSDAAPAGPTYNETKSINDGPVTVAAGEHWLITGTGTQTSNTMSIGAGATVTLDGVNIGSGSYCIKCLGEATIILKDGSTNTLTSTAGDYPALSIGDANTTLTIQGSTGVLNVTSGQYCAGIGGGYANTNKTCGNIRIEGGVITAQGGYNGAGIGSDSYEANCGDIIITGGTITAKGGTNAAGIGTGYGSGNPAVCGAITIANTVTKVTATKGDEYAPHSIGKGNGDKASCGTVTIGGTVYWQNNAAVNGGDTYLATSPLIYAPSN